MHPINLHVKLAGKNHRAETFTEWHNKTGHISISHYQQLAKMCADVPMFDTKTMEQHDCMPCFTTKMKKAPLKLTKGKDLDGELHFDISGSMLESIGVNRFAAHLLKTRTVTTTVVPLEKKSDLARVILAHIREVESHLADENYLIRVLRCDRAKENYPANVTEFNLHRGIQNAFSPAYAPESKGAADHLVQGILTRTCVLPFGSSVVPFNLWGEALANENWLRNRLPSSHINEDIPIHRSDKKTLIDLKNLLPFGQPGYAFIYYPHTQPGKKLLPRSDLCHFFGMESDIRLVRMYVPANNTVRIVRPKDFHPLKGNRIPDVSSLIDGLASQKELEGQRNTPLHPEVDVEERLVQTMLAIYHKTPFLECVDPGTHLHHRYNVVPHKSHQNTYDSPPLPPSFADAFQQPKWAEAINREFNALVERGIWK